jgi:hypothetical protein
MTSVGNSGQWLVVGGQGRAGGVIRDGIESLMNLYALPDGLTFGLLPRVAVVEWRSEGNGNV